MKRFLPSLHRRWLATIFLIWTFLWTSTAQTPVAQAQGPATPPDGVAGQQLFDNRCANCHGPLGGGDGELAANLPNPPASFSAPDYRNTAVPTDLFTTISVGRLTRGMPLFGDGSSNPIAEADRWHLVATIYSLSTPPEAIAAGQTLYEATCQDCHGPAGTSIATADLTDLNYWFTRSNDMVRTSLTDGTVTEHDFSLTETEAGNVVDFARTFSYIYNPPPVAIAAATIETAVVTGQIINGSRTELLDEGTVTLRGFTQELDIDVTITAAVDENGRYQFQLADVPADLIYVASANYGGIDFNSEPALLDTTQPALELPIIVYEQTTDPAAVTIDQILIVIDFIQDGLLINEVYVFSNEETAVFMGETGQPDDGTIQLAVPAGASNVRFERGFNNIDSLVPAPEVIQTETGWADTLPLQPGRSTLNLLVSYELPFRDGMTLAHPLNYDTNALLAFIPDVGVELTGDSWSGGTIADVPGGPYLNYNRSGLSANDALNLTLNGRPTVVTDITGNTLLVRDENRELLIGGSTLLLTLITAIVIGLRWRTPSTPTPATTDELLQAIANLDERYENGRINRRTYVQQRQRLKEQLTAQWPPT